MLGVTARSSAAAEKSGEGMALKICTGAKPFLKAYLSFFKITGKNLFLRFFVSYIMNPDE
jgi:hypothetical protein